MKSVKHFLHHEWKSLLWGVFLVLSMQTLEYSGWIAGIEGRILNWYLRAPIVFAKSEEPSIVLVEIDEEGYIDCMGGTSPIRPDYIRWLLDSLIIDGVHPRVIGVDILTDSTLYSDSSAYPYSQIRERAAAYAPTTIVWAAPPRIVTSFVPSLPAWMFGAEEVSVIEPANVLGQQPLKGGKLQEGGETYRWAIPAFPRDEDLRLRKFPRELRVAMTEQPEIESSWAMRIVELNKQEAGKNASHKAEHEEPAPTLLLSYRAPELKPYKLSEMFQCKTDKQRTATFDEFKGKVNSDASTIVLVGGSWNASNDFHNTPAGKLPGVQVNSLAVRSEMMGLRLHEAPRWLFIILDLMVAVAIVLASDVRWVRMMMLRSAGIVFIVFVISFLAFLLRYVWLSWIGVALGYAPHMLVEIYNKDPFIEERED